MKKFCYKTGAVAWIASCTSILAFVANPASAQSDSYPRISGAVTVEIENDWTYASEDRSNENNDLYTTIEPELTVQFTPNWSLFLHGVLEPVRDPEQFENRAFEDHGAFVEDIHFVYANGPFEAQAGKLNVGFGVAWDITPGLYGTDFAEDGYETSERIGALARWTFVTEGAGEHRISGGSFFQDTTILSESTLRGRGTTREEDGGVSNTEDFSSFVVAAQGSKFPGAKGVSYHAAYMHQAAGSGDTADENSLALAVYGRFGLFQDVTISPVVEFVHQNNAQGLSGQDRDFLTAGASANWHGANLSLAWTGRETDGASDQDDYQFQVSAGYAFEFGLTFDIGWKIANEANTETRTVGAVAAYTYNF